MGGLGGALDGASRWVDEHKRAIAYGKKRILCESKFNGSLFLGLYAAVAVGGGLVLRSIRVAAQFRFRVNVKFNTRSYNSFQLREGHP